MSKNTRVSGSDGSSSLYRLSHQFQSESPFTETQTSVDHLVRTGLDETTKGSMIFSVVGARWASSLTRAGVMSYAALSQERPLLALALRGASYPVALAGESAAFVGIEGAFRVREGHTFSQNFGQDWARAGINLGSIQFLTRAGAGNPVLSHVLADLGMVGGHHLVYAFNLGEKPEGTFAQQMVHAEAMNWSVKGGMALFHFMAPSLTASGQSLDLYLRAKEQSLSFPKSGSLVFLSQAEPLAEGAPNILSNGPKEAKPLEGPVVLAMSQDPKGGRGGQKEGPPNVINVIIDPSIANDPTESASRPRVPARADSVTNVLQVAPSPDNPYVGQVIQNKYVVENILGQGGMGIVFKCRHARLSNKYVAIKMLQPHVARDPNILERFKREALSTSAIGSDYIVKIDDIAELPAKLGAFPAGSTYIVMEFLQGEPLSAPISNGPIPLPRALHIARQLAEGLSDAHKAGIVHRDLKPDNIFIVNRPKTRERDRDSMGDAVKIVDFGLAKILDVPDEQQPNQPSRVMGIAGHRLTQIGNAASAMGTPEYMSPEQARNELVDPRTDIYAFGAILHEMVSGKDLFPVSYPSEPNRENLENYMKDILNMHAYAPPPRLRTLVPEIPEAFEKLVLRCLEKDRENRPKSMDEIVDEIIELQKIYPYGNGPISSSPPAPSVPTSRWPMVAGLGGGVTVVGFATAAFFMFGRSDPPPMSSSTPLSTDNIQPPPIPSASVSVTPTKPTKKVELRINPIDAKVFQGDKELSSNLIEVEEGKSVEVEIRSSGYISEVYVLDGSEGVLKINLQRDKGKPHPSANPSGKVPKPKPSGWNNGDMDDPWRRK